MRRSFKILLCAAFVYMFVTGGVEAHAISAPVNWPGFTAPNDRPPVPRPPITQDIPSQTPMFDLFGPNILNLVQDQRYEYVKGGEFFQDFYGLPDFRHFAWLSPLFVIPDPQGVRLMPSPIIQPFSFFGDDPNVYSYMFWTGVINYVTVDENTLADYYSFVVDMGIADSQFMPGAYMLPQNRLLSQAINRAAINPVAINTEALNQYKETIQLLGFEQRQPKYNQAIWSDLFPGYFDQIRLDILRDPIFTLDKDGVFVVESDNTFRVLLIGRSVVTDSFGFYWNSIEMRFYSLQGIPNDPLTIPEGLAGTPILLSNIIQNTPNQPTTATPRIEDPHQPWSPRR
jgi:hypothetical protein